MTMLPGVCLMTTSKSFGISWSGSALEPVVSVAKQVLHLGLAQKYTSDQAYSIINVNMIMIINMFFEFFFFCNRRLAPAVCNLLL